MAASAILATAAAVGAGLQREIATLTGSGSWLGSDGSGRGSSSGVDFFGGTPAAAIPSKNVTMLAMISSKVGKGRDLTSPFSDDSAGAFIGASSACSSVSSGCGSGCGSVCSSGRSSSERYQAPPSPLIGVSKEQTSDHGADHKVTSSASDKQQVLQQLQQQRAGGGCMPAAAAGAEAAAVASGRQQRQPLIIVHAATSTTYPATAYEAYNTTVDFLKAHPSPVCLLLGGARRLSYMAPTWQPSEGMVKFWKVYNWIKVAVVCFLLR